MLSPEEAFALLQSEAAEHPPSQTAMFSEQVFLERHLPAIVMEDPEVITDDDKAVHLLTFQSVFLDAPVSKTNGGFWDFTTPNACRLGRHTYSRPVVINVEYREYSTAPVTRKVGWESLSPADVMAEVRLHMMGRPTTDAESDNTVSAELGKAVANKGKTRTAPRRVRRRNISDVAPVAPSEDTWSLKSIRNYRQVVQFHVPIMVTSAGRDPVVGYYVIKGGERVLVPQTKLQINRWLIFASPRNGWTWTAEIRSCHSAKLRSTSTLRLDLKCAPDGGGPLRIVARVPYIECDIPLAALASLMGFSSDEGFATATASGAGLSGACPIVRGCPWDTPTFHSTRDWVLGALRDDADAWPSFFTMTREATLRWIGDAGCPRKSAEYRAKTVAHLLANEFLPHMGVDSAPRTIAGKGPMLAFAVWRLSQVARVKLPGAVPPDDRDHWGNKSVVTPGMLLGPIVRQGIRQSRKKLRADIRRQTDGTHFLSIPDLLVAKPLTDSMGFAMATGNWGMAKAGSSQMGVSQLMARQNAIASDSHQCRINTPMKREGKQVAPRRVSASSWGLVCPAETPEGASCGLVDQLATGVVVCIGHVTTDLIRCANRLLASHGLVPLLDQGSVTGDAIRLVPRPSMRSPEAFVTRVGITQHPPGAWDAVHASQVAQDSCMMGQSPSGVLRLLVNGVLVGFLGDGHQAANILRQGRMNGVLPFDVAIEVCVVQGTLTLNGEAGGLRRPLLRLDPDGDLGTVRSAVAKHARGAPADLWRALVAAGAVEYVSKHEEEGSLVVLANPCASPRDDIGAYTHSEVHPCMILGTAAGAIPFSDHNQAPRTTYFASMCKHTAGVPSGEGTASTSLRLWYPQSPLVTTVTSRVRGLDSTRGPCGMNVWVAVASPGGQNQDDSLYINADSAARGMFALTVVKNHTEDCHGGSGADAQRFERPGPQCVGKRTANYDKLRGDGTVGPGTTLVPGDAYIGKTTDVNELGCMRRTTLNRDLSHILPARDGPMVVDAVSRMSGREGREIMSVQMHTTRFLQTGDKMTSEHAQKGVVGAMRPACDMPYTAEGLVPDVIMNPHGFPSRMTIGQQIAMGLGLVAAANCDVVDGTPFQAQLSPQAIVDEMAAAGFSNAGHVQMWCGRTGAPIDTQLFFGPAYYLRTKQMVDDKHQARARGGVHTVTQQPLEGRSKDGGLRMGDMEVNALNAHGAAFAVWDRLFQQSDFSMQPLCTKCGSVAMHRAPAEVRDTVICRNEHTGFCDFCDTMGTVRSVPMPFATKLLAAELGAMHIRSQFEVETVADAPPDTQAAPSIGVFLHTCPRDAMMVDSAPAPATATPAPITDLPSGWS